MHNVHNLRTAIGCKVAVCLTAADPDAAAVTEAVDASTVACGDSADDTRPLATFRWAIAATGKQTVDGKNVY